MDASESTVRLSKGRLVSKEDAHDKLFTQILQALAELDAFSHPGNPSIFIVYAHDNEQGGAAAHADCVHRLIDWLKTVRCQLVSDKSPLGRWASRDAETDAVRNIISNQLRLLPDPRASGATGVDKVILCGSPLLEKYYHDSFTAQYLHSIREACIRDDEHQGQTRAAVETHCHLEGFHHVLTELAFLEFRKTAHQDHGIIPLSLNGGDLLYLPFLERTDLRLVSDTGLQKLHALFFKLLHQIYPKEHELIDTFKKCHKNACERLGDQIAFPIDRVQSIGQEEISKTQDRWQKHQQAAIRHVSHLRKETVGRQGSHPQHIIPFPKNNQFVGRASILKSLRERLEHDDHRKLAIVGLGGIGKTQVALQTAYWVKETKKDWSVFWLPAFSIASFQQACTDITQKLSLRRTDKEDPKDLVRDHLRSDESGRWLAVVDNADDEDLLFGNESSPGIYDYLPDVGHGRLLFTTRSEDIARDVRLAMNEDPIDLAKMSAEEGKTLWKQLAPREAADDAVAEELLNELTYLPLAISQAAAYVKRNRVTIRKYLELLHGAENEVVSLMSREFRDPMRYDESKHAVAMTWVISFQQIQKVDADAAQLLSFLSQIEPRAIPRSLLPRPSTEEELINAIGTLRGYAFLEQREEDNIFDMHRLVHLAARVWVNKEDRLQATRRASILHIAGIFPSDDWENRLLWRQYLPHALPLVRGCLEQGASNDVLAHSVGTCLRADGRTREAVEVFQSVMSFREKMLAVDHHDRLASQHELAIAYHANGQVKEAIKILEQVVAIEKRMLPEDHNDRLASQHALAGAYHANGQVKEAIEILEQVVAIEKVLSEDHPDQLTSQHELAIAYHANGQVKEAVKILEQVVAIEKRMLPEDHPNRLASQHELARAYHANGQVKEAIKILEKVMAIKKALSEDHPDRLASQHELARAYHANGQVKEAVKILEQVVAIEKALSEDHPDRLASQYELARAYHANWQVKEAIEILEQVVAIEKALSEDHPDRLASQHELAIAYHANGQVKEAIEILGGVVAIRKRTLSEDHPDRLASQHALGEAYEANGQVKVASR